MPQGLTVRGIQSKDTAVSISCEGQARCRGEHSCTRSTFSHLIGPAQLSCLVINRLNYAFAPQAIISACPSILAITWLSEIEAVTRVGVHNKESNFWVKTGSAIVGHSTFIRCNQASIGRRFFSGIRNGVSIFIHTQRPVYRPKWSGQKTFPVCTIEDKEVTIPGSLHQHLTWLPVEIAVCNNRCLCRVPIMGIVRRDRKTPHQLSCIRIQGDDTAGVKIVSWTRFPIKYGGRIARSPVEAIECRVVGSCHPR